MFIPYTRQEVHMKLYCGYLPLEWVRTISGRQGNAAALRVGILIWHRAGIEKKGNDLKITRKRAKECLAISPDSLKRGIARLEHLNLVTATRHPGRSTLVSIVDYEIFKKYGGYPSTHKIPEKGGGQPSSTSSHRLNTTTPRPLHEQPTARASYSPQILQISSCRYQSSNNFNKTPQIKPLFTQSETVQPSIMETEREYMINP